MSKKSNPMKIKVPKRVAGIKIPKTVRKGPVMDFVNSSSGRMLIAEALTAAIAALAIKNSNSGPARTIKDGLEGARDGVKSGAVRLSYAFGEGVRAFREALSGPPDIAASQDDHAMDSEDVESTADSADSTASTASTDSGLSSNSDVEAEVAKKKRRSPRFQTTDTPM